MKDQMRRVKGSCEDRRWLSVPIYHNTRFRADTVRLCERLEYVPQDWGKTKTNLFKEHTLQTTNHYIHTHWLIWLTPPKKKKNQKTHKMKTNIRPHTHTQTHIINHTCTPPEVSVPTVCHHLLTHHISKTSILSGAHHTHTHSHTVCGKHVGGLA